MSAPLTKAQLLSLLLICAFVALVALTFAHTHHAIRKERVCTRLSVQMAEGQHELVAALPSGRFQIQFTAKPNVSPGITVPPGPVLPAHISTSILRQDGSRILEPTQAEYVTFTVADGDAFRPLRLSVGVMKTNECTIYMNLASGF
jgi:hypothetical protein